jgi:hypothetical protein
MRLDRADRFTPTHDNSDRTEWKVGSPNNLFERHCIIELTLSIYNLADAPKVFVGQVPSRDDYYKASLGSTKRNID